jgi:hypothetical protein
VTTHAETYTVEAAMAASTTVRVTPETRERLARLAKARGLSTPELVDLLARRAEEDVLLDRMNSHYAALRSDPAAWEEHVRERELWEVTLGDGLDPER